MTLLTGGHLAKIGRRKHRQLMDQLAEATNYWCAQHGVTDDYEVAFILANCAVETGGFTKLKENMNYSEKRLKQVFSYYRKRPNLARSHARNPEMIANTVYADKNRGKRYKLGNTVEGDGWLFRGNGPPQLTGRSNHQRFKDTTGIDVVNHPELLEDPHTGMQATVLFYINTPGLRKAVQARNVKLGRKYWNGGSHGLNDIERVYLPRALAVMRVVDIIEADKPEEEECGVEGDDNGNYVDAHSTPAMVMAMQRLLNEKNFKCGAVDGRIGPATRSAMRGFLDHVGQPVEPLRVDLDELESAAPFVLETRAELTHTEAKETLIENGSRHMATAGRKKWFGGGVAAVSAGAASAKEQVEEVKGVIDSVRGMLSPLKPVFDFALDHWWLILPALGAYIWIEGEMTQRLRVKIWKTGEHH